MSKNYEEQYLEVVASNPNAIIYVPKDEISELIILTAIENGHVNNLVRVINPEIISFNIIEGLLKNHSAEEIIDLIISTDFALEDNIDTCKLVSVIEQLYSKDCNPRRSQTNRYIDRLIEKYNDTDTEFAINIISSILLSSSIDRAYIYHLINGYSLLKRVTCNILESYSESYSDNSILKEIFFLVNDFNTGFKKYREIFTDASFEEYVDKYQQSKKDIETYNGKYDLI